MFIRFLFVFLLSSACLFSKENKDPWVLLVKQCGKEKIMVRFPEDPEFDFFQEEIKHHFYSNVFETEYHLRIEQREKREKEEIFKQVLSKIENSKELALIETKQKNSKNKTYLDLKVKVEDKQFYESRTYLSKYHIFTLETYYPINGISTQNDFVKSFQIII